MIDNKNDDVKYVVTKTPNSIDRLLSKELLKLSLKDRNAVDEEIHGVSTLAPRESAKFLEDSLRELSEEIERIPVDNPIKTSYIESQILPDTYVNTSDFRLRFLRCELFDAKKAAIRMIKFLDLATHLFGPGVLQRPISMADFTKEEKKRLGDGDYQILPYRDQSGRSVTAWVGDCKWGVESVVARWKINMYLQYCMSDDIETQQKGYTHIVWPKNDAVEYDWQEFEYSERLNQATPVRKVSVHYCIPELPFYHPLHAVRCGHAFAVGNNKHRMKFHVGERFELLYKLKTFGIPVEYIPTTNSGQVKTKNLRQWIRFRNYLDDIRKKGSPDDSSITLSPSSTDVIFQGGKSLLCHPGNVMFENIVGEKLEEHSSASKKEKIAITKEIISAVQRKGSFWTWDKRGFWIELKDESLIHFKVAQKVRTLTGKLVAQQQISESGTFAFQNQDNSKRRKLLSRDESDGGNCCINLY